MKDIALKILLREGNYLQHCWMYITSLPRIYTNVVNELFSVQI